MAALPKSLSGQPWWARRTSRGARAASAATTDETCLKARRRREEPAPRSQPPDRSPQPPWLLGQPPSPRGRVPLERGLPLDRPGVGRLHSWSVTRAAHLLTGPDGKPTRDQPWIFRTYAGHTNVRASNALYRGNLSRGQTGLSIAFDLPTQCCYASDHPPAQSELGK